MIFDLLSLQLATSTVILVSASMYLLETLMRRDGAAGRLWAAAFLSGMFSALCYLVWILVPAAFVAVAVGNGAFVAATAFIWLGCTAFNGRAMRVPVAVVAVAVLVVVIAALVPGPAGGDWAGAVPLFLGNALFATLGAVETRRGAIGRRWSAAGLSVVMALEALWFLARTVVFVAVGPEHELFRGAFGSETASFLTMVLVVAAVVVTSVLRASETALRGQADLVHLTVDRHGILQPASFRAALGTLIQRATASGESVVLFAVRVDDARAVATAFGPDEAEIIATAFRAAVRRHAPTMALVGETDATALTIAFVPAPGVDVRRISATLHERVVAELAALGMSIVPVVGFGSACTEEDGPDPAALLGRADRAAATAAATGVQPFS